MDYMTYLLKAMPLLASALKKSLEEKIAAAEIEAAIMVGECIEKEENRRETLNRMLCHLESAYVQYSKTIKTWNIYDKDKVLWKKYETHNKLCFYIAILHYELNNTTMVKHWLLEKFSNRGPWDFSESEDGYFYRGDADKLNFFDKYYYGKLLGKSNPEFYDKIIKPSNDLLESMRRTELDDELDLMRVHLSI